MRNSMEPSDAFYPLAYFCRRFGGAGGLRYVGDDNPDSVVSSCDLKQLCAEAESTDGIAVLP